MYFTGRTNKCALALYYICMPNTCVLYWLLFALLYCYVPAFVQWGLINICLGTWERRYNLSSSQSVWIITTQEIVAGIFSPLFGYFAVFWHKGRMLTAGAFCMVIANFLFLVPQFATDPYALGTSEAGGTCVPNGKFVPHFAYSQSANFRRKTNRDFFHIQP